MLGGLRHPATAAGLLTARRLRMSDVRLLGIWADREVLSSHFPAKGVSGTARVRHLTPAQDWFHVALGPAILSPEHGR